MTTREGTSCPVTCSPAEGVYKENIEMHSLNLAGILILLIVIALFAFAWVAL
ncbi:hypothetical protein ACVMB2_002129 [Sinorhizobium meliloti]